jgi:hypothetical protein
MTTTIIYAATGDGYIQSTNVTYATAQAGSGLTAQTSAAGYYGQSLSSGTFAHQQTFLRFTYSAIAATEQVTSAAIQVRVASTQSPAVARDLELRQFTWSGSGLTTADWRNAGNLSAAPLLATVSSINAAAVSARTRAGSETLRAAVAAGTAIEAVAVSSRQVDGIVPTSDESASIHLSGAAGTTSDPALVFTTVTKSRMFGVLGAAAQLSDQTWVYLEHNGTGVDLKHISATGTVTTVATVPIGTTSSTFAAPTAAQSLALVADPATNLFIVGRVGNATNSIMIRRYARYPGIQWVGTSPLVAALPSHSAPINQVAAAYLATSTPTVLVLAAHSTGTLVPAGSSDVAWAAFTANALPALLAVGDASNLSDLIAPAGDYGGHRNEVGAGLDIVPSKDNAGWTYAASFRRGQAPGDNASQALARMIYDGGMDHASRQITTVYGVKDASAKMRAVEATGGVAALVTADRDSGYGISVSLRQHTGVTAGSITLAEISLAGESIPSMPDGPAVAATLAWDASFSELENCLWVYYVDTTNSLRIRRTPISLDSYTATRQEVTVYTAPAGSTIQAVRVPRGARIVNRTLVQVAYVNGGVNTLANIVDVYNVAPAAPTQTVRSGVDATLAFDLGWTFADPNPGDTQSAYQIQIEDTAAPGVAVVDTGKVVSTAQSRTIAAGTLANGKTYQWRVRTYDQLDLVGAYSAYAQFPSAAGGAVTITSPAADNPAGVATDEYQVTWSAAGTVQAAYRVWLYRGVTLVSDSGWVTSTAQTYLVTDMTSDVQHEVRVQVRNAAAVTSNIGTRLITPSYGTPERPVATVNPLPELGCVQIQVFNPTPGQQSGAGPEYGFEPGDATVYVTEGCTFTSGDTTRAYRGTGSGKIVAAGGTPARMWPADALAVTAGQRYTVRYWAWHATGRNAYAAIDWRTADETPLTTLTIAVAIPAATWTLVTATGTAPDGTVRARAGARMLSPVLPTAGETMWIEDLLLAPASDRPDTIVNEIYRREVGAVDWDLLGTCPPDSVYRDYTASAGVAYEFKVRAVA